MKYFKTFVLSTSWVQSRKVSLTNFFRVTVLAVQEVILDDHSNSLNDYPIKNIKNKIGIVNLAYSIQNV